MRTHKKSGTLKRALTRPDVHCDHGGLTSSTVRRKCVVCKLSAILLSQSKRTKTGIIVENPWALEPGISELKSWLCKLPAIKHGEMY